MNEMETQVDDMNVNEEEDGWDSDWRRKEREGGGDSHRAHKHWGTELLSSSW